MLCTNVVFDFHMIYKVTKLLSYVYLVCVYKPLPSSVFGI